MSGQYSTQLIVFADKTDVLTVCVDALKRIGWKCSCDAMAGTIKAQTPESLVNWSYGVDLYIDIVRSSKQAATMVSTMTEYRRRFGLIKGAESITEAEEIVKKFIETATWLFDRNGIEYDTP
jgi:hypothetical protein